MVDHAALGRTGEPFEMELERGKIREFARATYSTNESYLDDPAPVGVARPAPHPCPFSHRPPPDREKGT